MDKIDQQANNGDNLWSTLRDYTAARIAIGRTGNSIPLNQLLDFKLAHAHARDAVYSELDTDGITSALRPFDLPVFHLHSKATSRQKYLKRPDYGRVLDEESKVQLKGYESVEPDVAIIITDGLSATAVNLYAVSLLQLLTPKILNVGLKPAPFILVKQGRVAVADEVAYAFRAKLSVILIGERPGLSSPDSMGAYLTYNPKPGLTDECRNCISNIRPDGLLLAAAADKIFYLISEALKRKLSGIALKDNAGLLGG